VEDAVTTKSNTSDRDRLAAALNEDLAREYQAIIAYVIYSQMLKGAAYMTIAEELERHAGEELQHALTIAKHIDYLGGTPTVTPKPVKVEEEAEAILRADLENENDTVRHYRVRVKECEAIGEYAIAEDIREILRQEQEHQIDLATALGIGVPDIIRRARRLYGPLPAFATSAAPQDRQRTPHAPLHAPDRFPAHPLPDMPDRAAETRASCPDDTARQASGQSRACL
jgi:bacterioferritin